MRTLKLTFKKLSAGIVLLQWFGNLAAMLLAFLWLQIPDSHAWELLFSAVAAALLIFAFLGLHARTFRLLQLQETTIRLWPRLLILLMVIVAAFLLWQGIEAGRSQEWRFAGYWNSRFSAGSRSFFTYQRLFRWQEYFYSILQWVLDALLLPVAFVGASIGLQKDGRRRIGLIYRHFAYWVVAVLAGLIGQGITSALVSWTPGHGTAAEIASVLLRFGVAYTADILLWCLVLAAAAVSAGRVRGAEPAP